MARSAAIGPAALNNPTFRTMADLLNNQDIKEWLKKLPEWDLEKKHIERTFEFDDFTLAMDFVNSVAEIAEEEDHHPNIDIRYNKVRIELSTHSEGGLTDMDFELAEKIDTLVEEECGLRRVRGPTTILSPDANPLAGARSSRGFWFSSLQSPCGATWNGAAHRRRPRRCRPLCRRSQESGVRESKWNSVLAILRFNCSTSNSPAISPRPLTPDS